MTATSAVISGVLVSSTGSSSNASLTSPETSPARSAGSAAAPVSGLPRALYYEGFDADPKIGSIAGYHGFLPSTAKGAKNAIIVPGSLDYTDSAKNRLITTGNAAFADARQSSGIVSNVAPIVLSSVKGSTLWISFVGRQTDGVNSRFINVSLRGPRNTLELPGTLGNEDEIMILGRQSTPGHDFWEIWDRGSSATTMENAASHVPATEQSFLLGRMEINVDGGTRERFTLWVNPRLDVPPPEDKGFQFLSKVSNIQRISQIDRVRIGAGAALEGQPAAAWVVDEIRVGETREAVCPFVRAGK
jgi:hypothetical protein